MYREELHQHLGVDLHSGQLLPVLLTNQAGPTPTASDRQTNSIQPRSSRLTEPLHPATERRIITLPPLTRRQTRTRRAVPKRHILALPSPTKRHPLSPPILTERHIRPSRSKSIHEDEPCHSYSLQADSTNCSKSTPIDRPNLIRPPLNGRPHQASSTQDDRPSQHCSGQDDTSNLILPGRHYSTSPDSTDRSDLSTPDKPSHADVSIPTMTSPFDKPSPGASLHFQTTYRLKPAQTHLDDKLNRIRSRRAASRTRPPQIPLTNPTESAPDDKSSRIAPHLHGTTYRLKTAQTRLEDKPDRARPHRPILTNPSVPFPIKMTYLHELNRTDPCCTTNLSHPIRYCMTILDDPHPIDGPSRDVTKHADISLRPLTNRPTLVDSTGHVSSLWSDKSNQYRTLRKDRSILLDSPLGDRSNHFESTPLDATNHDSSLLNDKPPRHASPPSDTPCPISPHSVNPVRHSESNLPEPGRQAISHQATLDPDDWPSPFAFTHSNLTLRPCTKLIKSNRHYQPSLIHTNPFSLTSPSRTNRLLLTGHIRSTLTRTTVHTSSSHAWSDLNDKPGPNKTDHEGSSYLSQPTWPTDHYDPAHPRSRRQIKSIRTKPLPTDSTQSDKSYQAPPILTKVTYLYGPFPLRQSGTAYFTFCPNDKPYLSNSKHARTTNHVHTYQFDPRRHSAPCCDAPERHTPAVRDLSRRNGRSARYMAHQVNPERPIRPSQATSGRAESSTFQHKIQAPAGAWVVCLNHEGGVT